MKPTIENLRKVAAELTDPHELSLLKDNVAFYITGVKRAAEALGKPVASVERLLDEARAAEEFIRNRISGLGE